MPDYCTVCGNADSNTDEGTYIPFQSVVSHIRTIETDLWVCNGCLEDNRIDQ